MSTTSWPKSLNGCGGELLQQDEDEYLDVRLQIAGTDEVLDASKVVLASASPYFEDLLCRIGNDELLLLDSKLSSDPLVVKTLVRFFHGGEAAVRDLTHFVAMVEACELTGAQPLAEELRKMLSDFSADDILAMMSGMDEESSVQLRNHSVDFVARRFSELRESHRRELLLLKPFLMQEILTHDRLDVQEEIDVWEWVKMWIRQKGASPQSDSVLSAVRVGLISKGQFDERVRSEPFIAIKEYRKCQAWQNALAIQDHRWISNKQCLQLKSLATPRSPSGCVVAINLASQSRDTKYFDILTLDVAASKFKVASSFTLSSSMRIEGVLPSPFRPAEIVVLQKSWRHHQAYRALTFDLERQVSEPLPSFPSKGEKTLCVSSGELMAFTSRPKQRVDVLSPSDKLWLQLYESEVEDSLFGSIVVSVKDDFYVVGGVQATGNWLDVHVSTVAKFDRGAAALKIVGELLTRRMNATGCEWTREGSDGLVVAGGMWPDGQTSGVPVEYYDVQKATATKLANIPIPHGRYFHMSQCQAGLLVIVEYPIRGRSHIYKYEKEEDRWCPWTIILEKTLRIKGMAHLKLQHVEAHAPFESTRNHIQYCDQAVRRRSKKKAGRGKTTGGRGTPAHWSLALLSMLLFLYRLTFGMA